MSEAQTEIASPTAAAQPAATAKALTEYLVLAKDDNSGFWTETKKVKARSPRAAVTAIVTELGPTFQGGTFVATPARSWDPLTVKPEQTTRLVFD
jgi:hypothetical protein